MDFWTELLERVMGLDYPQLREGLPRQASPELIALEKEAAELPRWPGEDVLADASLAHLADLHRLQAELMPDLAEILYSQSPRDADQAKAEALWIEIETIRLGGTNVLNQALVEFAHANGVRMETVESFVLPPPTGAELPGGAMMLPPVQRRALAATHLSEVRGVCNQGVAVMNHAVGLSSQPEADLSALQEPMTQARSEMDAVPAWIGDAEFRDACSAVLKTQAGFLEKEIPAMQETLGGGDVDGFNTASRALSSELRALQLDLYDAEANFRVRWGLRALDAPPPAMDYTGIDQAQDRLRHWSGLVNEAVLLSTQMRINVLLDGAEYEEQTKLVSARLVELQAQAEHPPTFDGEDPLRKPTIAVLDVLEQSFGDWGGESAQLLHTPKPREAHQQRFLAIVEEEAQAIEKALADYRLAHKLFAEQHGISLTSIQTISSLYPPRFLVQLPGPAVELPAQVRISFAAGHMAEVGHSFRAGLQAWNELVGAPIEDWPEQLPQSRAVVAAALKEVLSIPPWMGEETMVQGAAAVLSVWLQFLEKDAPRMIKLLSGERSQKDVDQFNKMMDELNQVGREGVGDWNAANEQWAEDWQFAASKAHQEALVDWARDSRELLKSR